jgi:hypothetical protein
MSSYVFDGKVRATWCPTIGNIALPTHQELDGGTALEGYITPDGLDITPKDASVDTSTLKSAVNSAKPGRIDYQVSLTCLRDDVTDVAWSLFTRGTVGFLVVRDNLDSSVGWVAGQNVAVYPGTVGIPKKDKIAINKRQSFSVELFMGGSANQVPNERATVA